MTTAWSHLPNAKHIDWVLASLKSHPTKWSVAWSAARDAAWDAAWDAVRDAARSAARSAAWSAAWSAAGGAILALIAYDDCGYLLNSNPEEVKLLAKFGVPAAILLLPACIILNEIKEIK